jgi:hypothetical protein
MEEERAAPLDDLEAEYEAEDDEGLGDAGNSYYCGGVTSGPVATG